MIHYIYWTNLATSMQVSLYYFRDDMMNNTNADYQWCKGLKGLDSNTKYNPRKIVLDMLRESEEDSFVFIVTKSQLPSLHKWFEQEQLKDLIIFNTERGVTNGNHSESKRNLNMFVLAAKNHPMWDMFTTEEEMESV